MSCASLIEKVGSPSSVCPIGNFIMGISVAEFLALLIKFMFCLQRGPTPATCRKKNEITLLKRRVPEV